MGFILLIVEIKLYAHFILKNPRWHESKYYALPSTKENTQAFIDAVNKMEIR